MIASEAIGFIAKGCLLARRRYQKGQVILQGTSWYGRYRESILGPDCGERRIRRNTLLGTKKDFPTKRLAERQLEILLAPLNSIAYRPGRVATIEEFAERWQREVLSQRKASTVYTKQSHLRVQIVPILGKLRLNELTVENQQLFVNRLSGTVSRRMLVNVLSTLSSMLETAKTGAIPARK